MQATLPVRTWNTPAMGLVALTLAAIIVLGAALAFGASRTVPAAVDVPAAQTIDQSVLNHVIDERAHPAAVPAPRSVDPARGDRVGTRNDVQAPLVVDPDVGAGARSRIVNVPQ